MAINLERLRRLKFSAYTESASTEDAFSTEPLLFVNDCCFHISVQDKSHGSYAQAMEPQISSEERKQKWEQGQADYMGMDSFDNIKKKLDTFLK